MSSDHFSPVARTYDAAFTETLVGRMQRQIVWDFLDNLLAGRPLRVLEINCGTGEDALWLARRGCAVLATDASAEMVAVAREKALQAGLNIETRVCDFAGLAQLPEGDFDLVFSNFGGLNCIPPEELAALWPVLFGKLRPGGQVVAVLMGRFCWWETLYFLLKGRWRQAFRRWSGGPVTASLDGVSSVQTWYASAASAAAPVGFWLPPSYLNPFFERRPRLLRCLYGLEQRCRGRWWALGADHFVAPTSRSALLREETPRDYPD